VLTTATDLDVVSHGSDETIERPMVQRLVNNELERIWKEAIIFKFVLLSRKLPRRTGKGARTTKSFGTAYHRVRNGINFIL
jgi:hypothetical protein